MDKEALDLSWLDTVEARDQLSRITDFRRSLLDSGLPPIDKSKPPVSRFEFWPMWRLYGVMILYCLWLGLRHGGLRLPSVTNPGLPLSGWIGESKIDIYDSLFGEARSILPDYVGIMPQDIELGVDHIARKVEEGGIAYPYIAKPAIGCRGAGVQIITDKEKLRAYLQDFPSDGEIVMQRMVPYMGEAGVFYIRMPNQRQGKIFGITLKYFLEVEGDGKTTLEKLIEQHWRAKFIPFIYKRRHQEKLSEVIEEGQKFRINFTGSHSRGTIFREGTHHATKELREAMDRVADGIPEFYFGRFDFRFRNFNEFLQGKNFALLEINGAGGEATNVWDSGKSIWRVYSILKEQYNIMYKIGRINRNRGFVEARYVDIYKAWLKEKNLMERYPHTD